MLQPEVVGSYKLGKGRLLKVDLPSFIPYLGPRACVSLSHIKADGGSSRNTLSERSWELAHLERFEKQRIDIAKKGK